MTPHDMTDEQLRIRVAELLGITDIEEADGAICPIEDIGTWDGKKNGIPCDVPDYPHDLNACREMVRSEQLINDSHWFRALERICGDQSTMIDATARQRCEAFVEVMEGR